MRLSPPKSKTSETPPSVGPTVRLRRDGKESAVPALPPSVVTQEVGVEEEGEVEDEPPPPPKEKEVTKVKAKTKAPRSDRQTGLSNLISSISKKHGEGALIQMDQAAIKHVSSISSGSLGLDYALGIGGYPRGRIAEVYGPASAGKSTLTLHAIAECQKAGGVAAFIDAEHAMDLQYAMKVGVDVESLLFAQPDYGEQALNIAEEIVKADVVDLIVIDSVAALTPRAEIEADMEKMQVGLQARMMSKALRKLTAIISKTNTCLIFINQIREKVGVTWGSNETVPGGRALKFYCSMRVDVRRVASVKRKEEIIGNRVKVKVTKNKLAAPHKECQFDIIFGHGIDADGDLIDIATSYGLIDKSGSWFSYEGTKIGQGKESVVKYLSDNKDIKTKLEDTIRQDLFGDTDGTKT